MMPGFKEKPFVLNKGSGDEPPTPGNILSVIPETIPQELKKRDQWVVWKAEPKPNGKINKPPYQPKAPNIKASKSNPAHWSSFDDAMKAYQENDSVAGIGYVVLPTDNLVMSDLDHCIEDDGLPNADAQDAINTLSSYAELSPSGTGVRIICQGKLPGRQFNNRKLGREMYDGQSASYLTITGHQLDSMDTIEPAQEAITHLYNKWATKTTTNQQTEDLELGDLPTEVDLSRLDQYTIDLIHKGDTDGAYPSRSEALLGACKDMIRAGYSAEETLVTVTDPRNAISLPAWDRRKNHASAREWVSRYTLSRAVSEVEAEVQFSIDVTHFGASPKEAPAERPQETADKIPALLLNPPGLVGEIADIILAASYRPQPIFAVATSLVALSIVSMNHYEPAYMGGSLNLYTVQVGLSGAGKDDGRKAISSLMDELGMLEHLVEDFASGPALLRKLSEVASLLYSPDEFGMMMQAAIIGKGSGAHLKTVVDELIKLYTKASSVYTGRYYSDIRQNIDPIRNPFVSVLGSTTPGELAKGLITDQIDNGLLNRFLYIESESMPDLENPRPADFSKLKDRLLTIKDRNTGELIIDYGGAMVPRTVIRFDDLAVSTLRAFNSEIDELRASGGRYEALWVRAHENAVRVASVIGLGDALDPKQAIVKQAHAQWAVAFVKWCVNGLIKHIEENMAESEFDAHRQKILKIFRDAPKYARTKYGKERGWLDVVEAGAVPRALIQRHSRLKPREIDEVIKSMVDSEEIEQGEIVSQDQEEGKKRGRSPIIYRLIKGE